MGTTPVTHWSERPVSSFRPRRKKGVTLDNRSRSEQVMPGAKVKQTQMTPAADVLGVIQSAQADTVTVKILRDRYHPERVGTVVTDNLRDWEAASR